MTKTLERNLNVSFLYLPFKRKCIVTYDWQETFQNIIHRFVYTRLITHAKQLLEDNEEALCVRVLQTIKGMMARDIDFGDKVSRTNILQFTVKSDRSLSPSLF